MISKGKRPRLADTFSFCAISALSQRYVILELISHESNGISHFVAKFDWPLFDFSFFSTALIYFEQLMCPLPPRDCFFLFYPLPTEILQAQSCCTCHPSVMVCIFSTSWERFLSYRHLSMFAEACPRRRLRAWECIRLEGEPGDLFVWPQLPCWRQGANWQITFLSPK